MDPLQVVTHTNHNILSAVIEHVISFTINTYSKPLATLIVGPISQEEGGGERGREGGGGGRGGSHPP